MQPIPFAIRSITSKVRLSKNVPCIHSMQPPYKLHTRKAKIIAFKRLNGGDAYNFNEMITPKHKTAYTKAWANLSASQIDREGKSSPGITERIKMRSAQEPVNQGILFEDIPGS